MSHFFPLLNMPNLTAWTTVYNYSPNQCEGVGQGVKFLTVSWVEGGLWRSSLIGELAYGSSLKIEYKDLVKNYGVSGIALLSLSKTLLPEFSSVLPKLAFTSTQLPSWRATIGLDSDWASTSYQGEISPFSAKGSLLSFSPFVQHSSDQLIENFFLFLNIENSPVKRKVNMKAYSLPLQQTKDTHVFEVENNAVNMVNLNEFNLSKGLVAFSSLEMAGIPLFLSIGHGGAELSLEHTHPTASLFLHGDRFGLQRLVKNLWFEKFQV